MNSKDPNYREKISKLVKKYGGKDPVFLENCIDIFDSFADLDWHPDSKRYLHECIPVSEIKIDNFIILTASRIIEESKDMIPGVYVSKLGFIPIATYYSGDSYVLEAATAAWFSVLRTASMTSLELIRVGTPHLRKSCRGSKSIKIAFFPRRKYHFQIFLTSWIT